MINLSDTEMDAAGSDTSDYETNFSGKPTSGPEDKSTYHVNYEQVLAGIQLTVLDMIKQKFTAHLQIPQTRKHNF